MPCRGGFRAEEMGDLVPRVRQAANQAVCAAIAVKTALAGPERGKKRASGETRGESRTTATTTTRVGVGSDAERVCRVECDEVRAQGRAALDRPPAQGALAARSIPRTSYCRIDEEEKTS